MMNFAGGLEMPMNRALYPENWEAIALEIKEAANWTCQNCGRPCRRLGVSWDDFADWIFNKSPAWWSELEEEVYDNQTGEWGYVPKVQRFTLAVAHLNHHPEDSRPENLKALCTPCHCRYDLKQMGLKKRLKLERKGQLNLFNEVLNAS